MIVPVKKVRLLVSQHEQEKLIKVIQKENKFMLFNYNEEAALPTSLSQELTKIERGIKELSKYEKKNFFAYHEISESSFENSEKEALVLLATVKANVELIEHNEARLKEINEQTTLLKPYFNVSVATKELTELVKTRIVIGYLPLVSFIDFARELNEKGYIFEESSRDAEFVYGAFGYELVFENQAMLLLNTFQFNEVHLPAFTTKLSQLLPELNDEVAALELEISAKKAELKALSSETNKLRAYYDYFYNKAMRSQVVVGKTEKVTYLEGWVREDEFVKFTESVKQKIDCEIEELTVQNEELVPTATKNNKFVQQFEIITNMFSVPNQKEVDPNPVMSVWYWLIFGIMMGDVGYGLVMLILFTLFLKLKKPKGTIKNLVTIFAFSSITTIIFGVLTGGFFGLTVDFGNIIGNWFGQTGWTTIVFDPINDPIPMLVFSIVIGIFHIISGLIIKIINEVRRKDVLSAFADGVSWISILVGLVLAVLDFMILKSNVLMWIGLGLVLFGVLLILTLAGRSKKNFFGKVVSGLGGIYGVTSYLSDILSYSRILALSLSSAVIAFTMNTLAQMVIGVPVVGIIFAIIVLLIGHIFNLVMGLLSAYVHDGRLQYLEFFGKFYEGGGYEFSPFTYKLKYINEIKENK